MSDVFLDADEVLFHQFDSSTHQMSLYTSDIISPSEIELFLDDLFNFQNITSSKTRIYIEDIILILYILLYSIQCKQEHNDDTMLEN